MLTLEVNFCLLIVFIILIVLNTVNNLLFVVIVVICPVYSYIGRPGLILTTNIFSIVICLCQNVKSSRNR